MPRHGPTPLLKRIQRFIADYAPGRGHDRQTGFFPIIQKGQGETDPRLHQLEVRANGHQYFYARGGLSVALYHPRQEGGTPATRYIPAPEDKTHPDQETRQKGKNIVQIWTRLHYILPAKRPQINGFRYNIIFVMYLGAVHK